MCSHVAAILWYLGHARHQRDEKLGVRDWGEFVDDATLVDDSDSSSESDESGPEVVMGIGKNFIIDDWGRNILEHTCNEGETTQFLLYRDRGPVNRQTEQTTVDVMESEKN
ncbi:uncharacterized protein LOC128161402 [Crassostrea angulata]|uniref:uncharacterized protein LOC128161402 n=1 Tax=Magallana angulata TaxID=2784310 RepID=UPI0022B18B05|nr:uncharacterized protein LOC128161402 [Crassostrea angulata]